MTDEERDRRDALYMRRAVPEGYTDEYYSLVSDVDSAYYEGGGVKSGVDILIREIVKLRAEIDRLKDS